MESRNAPTKASIARDKSRDAARHAAGDAFLDAALAARAEGKDLRAQLHAGLDEFATVIEAAKAARSTKA
jgi:hypothetical protein